MLDDGTYDAVMEKLDDGAYDAVMEKLDDIEV
jgi:hypothetical protein